MKKQRQQFADTMHALGQQDGDLTVLVGDISHGILQEFASACPGRYYNVGICEPTIVNMAAGLSKVGLVPVIHTIAPFITERSYEQIKLDFGYQKLPVNIISVGSAFDYSQLGCSHHCYSDVSLFMHLKDSSVFMPGNAEEFDSLFRANYRNDRINYFRLSEQNHDVKVPKAKLELGEAVVVREGSDITVAVVGPMLQNVLTAVKTVVDGGIDAEVLYFPTIKPFDGVGLSRSVAKTKRLLTVEELSSHGGLYHSALGHCVGIAGLSCAQLAIFDFVRDYGTHDELLEKAGLSDRHIVEAILSLMRDKCS